MKRAIIVFFVSACVIVALAVLVVIYGTETPKSQKTATPEVRSLVPLETDPSQGPASAPVTAIAMSSFTCPACKITAGQMDQLAALYPDKVRIVWKDLPDSTGDAYRAAIAGRCAQMQGKFWQYHDVLYLKQDLLATRELYTLWAKELGLSTDRFDTCLDKEQTKDLVDASIAEGLHVGVSQVPHVQIGTAVYEGPQTLNFYRTAIEQALAKQ